MTKKKDSSTTRPRAAKRVAFTATKPAVISDTASAPDVKPVASVVAKKAVVKEVKVESPVIPVLTLGDISIGSMFKKVPDDGNVYRKITPIMRYDTGSLQYGADRIVVDPSRGPIVSGGEVMNAIQGVQLI